MYILLHVVQIPLFAIRVHGSRSRRSYQLQDKNLQIKLLLSYTKWFLQSYMQHLDLEEINS